MAGQSPALSTGNVRWPIMRYGLGVLALAAATLLMWPGLLRNLFSQGFLPHGVCLAWEPRLLWLHVVSDSLIGLSYVAISFTLAWLVHRARRDMPFQWVFLAFGLFIIACGLTHFVEVLTLWKPFYWFAGDIKLITAVASVATAIVLPPLVPKTLDLIKAVKISEERKHKLESANRELQSATDKLRELDQLKTQFFANVSHELRTPLALMLGRTEKLLHASSTTEAQRKELIIVHRNARALLKQVNDLLDISKLDAGRMGLDYAEADLARLVRRSGAHFESLAAERQITFFVSAPPTLRVQIDPEKLERVLLNLLANAFKFTPDGGSIRMELIPGDGTAQIIVADSGPGVRAELREAIFERFRQGDAASTRRFSGTGLGLSIVKDFVQMHRGRIDLEEAPGGGALFRVELPLTAPEEAAISAARVPQEAADLAQQIVDELRPVATERPVTDEYEAALASAPLVLVVEDNLEMNRFICESLAVEYRVASALDGPQGFDKALALHPDLILTDVMMPNLGGEQFVRQVREQREFDSVPIIVLTAKADAELRVNILRHGAQDYIMKPFPVDELRARVRNLVSLSRARKMLQDELASQSQDLRELASELTFRKRQLQNALDAQRKSEHQFRRLAESNIIGVFFADLEGNIHDANDAFLGLVGYGRDELKAALRWRDITPPESAAADEQAIAELRATGACRPFEREFVRKDGTRVPALVGTALLEGSDNNCICFVLDLSDRKRAEARVAVQYGVARVLAESSDLQDAAPRILQVVCEGLGWDLGELWRVDAPAAVLRCVDLWKAPSLQVPEFEAFTRKTAFTKHDGVPGRVWATREPCWVLDLAREHAYLRAHIASREGLHSAFGFPIISNGEVLGVFVFLTRRTLHADPQLLDTMSGIGNQIGQFMERKRSETARFELASIVESSDDAIIGKSLDGTITSWNHGAERIYGYTAAEIVGRPIWDLCTPDRRAEIREILARIRRGIPVHHFQTERLTKDGRVLHVSLSVSPIRNAAGEITGASSIARDISEFKRAEESLRTSEKLATVGRLAATIAHEINNPLEAVTNVMYLLETQSEMDPMGQQYVELAQQELARITHIVKQTLGFNRESTAPVAFDPAQALDNVLDLYERRLHNSEISVERRYDHTGTISAFPGEMRQVFSNLIINAVEAIGVRGRIRLHVTSARDWKHPERAGIRVVVADTGTGVSGEHLNKLFEPFFTTKGEKGTGLGLWVSRGIVEKHGGSIRVRSSVRPGRSGTVFSVFLPTDSSAALEPRHASPRTHKTVDAA